MVNELFNKLARSIKGELGMNQHEFEVLYQNATRYYGYHSELYHRAWVKFVEDLILESRVEGFRRSSILRGNTPREETLNMSGVIKIKDLITLLQNRAKDLPADTDVIVYDDELELSWMPQETDEQYYERIGKLLTEVDAKMQREKRAKLIAERDKLQNRIKELNKAIGE